jgi:thiamine biosynthesis lipoprotein
MPITRRQLLGGLAGTLALAALPAAARDTIRLSGRAFGTSWTVTLPYGMAGTEPEAIAATLDTIDRSMSPFRADSQLSRFNAAATGSHAVDPALAHVAAEALRIAAWSGGAFDPTVGPLVGRYGFGPIHGERAGDFTGLSCDGARLAKADAGLSIDLCGIAKGHALDAVAARLRALGHDDFLIEIGGEILASGTGSSSRPWQLGIADPVAGGIHARLFVTNMALATSGDAINVYEVAGRRYSHTIDPNTGEPLRTAIASVSVAHPSAMTADGLATALLVLGPERGLALAEAEDLPVLYLLRGETGVTPRASRAFSALLAD